MISNQNQTGQATVEYVALAGIIVAIIISVYAVFQSNPTLITSIHETVSCVAYQPSTGCFRPPSVDSTPPEIEPPPDIPTPPPANNSNFWVNPLKGLGIGLGVGLTVLIGAGLVFGAALTTPFIIGIVAGSALLGTVYGGVSGDSFDPSKAILVSTLGSLLGAGAALGGSAVALSTFIQSGSISAGITLLSTLISEWGNDVSASELFLKLATSFVLGGVTYAATAGLLASSVVRYQSSIWLTKLHIPTATRILYRSVITKLNLSKVAASLAVGTGIGALSESVQLLMFNQQFSWTDLAVTSVFASFGAGLSIFRSYKPTSWLGKMPGPAVDIAVGGAGEATKAAVKGGTGEKN